MNNFAENFRGEIPREIQHSMPKIKLNKLNVIFGEKSWALFGYSKKVRAEQESPGTSFKMATIGAKFLRTKTIQKQRVRVYL